MRRALLTAGPKPLGPVGYDGGSGYTNGSETGIVWIQTGSLVITPTVARTLTSITFNAQQADSSAYFMTGSMPQTTFTVRDFQQVSIATGLQTYAVSLDMQPGDYLAIRWNGLHGYRYNSVSTNAGFIAYASSGVVPTVGQTYSIPTTINSRLMTWFGS